MAPCRIHVGSRFEALFRPLATNTNGNGNEWRARKLVVVTVLSAISKKGGFSCTIGMEIVESVLQDC